MRIQEIKLSWKTAFAVDVVAASKGYPDKYEKGLEISIDEDFPNNEDTMIFFAGIKEKEGTFLTDGGRVFAVTCVRETLKEAINASYENLKKISFDGIYYRKDIGFKGL